ncbi:hypothetical protein LCGC14_3032250, partial [marine sediment metagenome]
MVMVMRGMAAAVTASVVLATTLWFSPAADESALGNVLDKIAAAETLQLEITRDGKSSRLWAKQPQKLRLNEADGTYKIALGGRLWSIDEKANRATSGPSPYFRNDKPGLDLLALLELPDRSHEEDFLQQRPAERVQRDGVECDVYRIEIPAADGTIRLEAIVDAATRRLRSVETKSDRNGQLRPIAKVTMLAVNEPVDEELFVVGDTLTEDGRIGKVTDRQGIVSIKPVMHGRFTPVGSRMPIKPGDWLRTDSRGVNAVCVRLLKQTDVTLGPGSLVELVTPKQIRVIAGELK